MNINDLILTIGSAVGIHPPAELVHYVALLYERRNEGVILANKHMTIGDWSPVQNECHRNVTRLCEFNPKLTAVRGWLYFDFENALPHVRFTAHSAILEEDGLMYDVTPSLASQPYPFIRAQESEEEYAEMIESYNISNLDHFK